MTGKTVLLSGVVGSQAYGLATPESDTDRLGLFAAQTEELLGLYSPDETTVSVNPDITYHEARKYARLALGGNPTVMELMWLEEYDTIHPRGRELIEIRREFLSAPRVRNAYLGYATQQMKRLKERGDGSFSSDTRKRTAKHARHLARLCWQGHRLYWTGELVIRLPELTALSIREFGDKVAAGDIDAAESHIAAYEYLFDTTRSPLPDRPDEETVNDWLVSVRKQFL
jgi:uncharacterized protein